MIRIVYCPICKRKISTINDEYSSNRVAIKCRNCDKLIIFNFEYGTHEIKNVPKRNSSSGMRFY